MSHLEKYIDWKYLEIARPNQTKTQERYSEDINCSLLFNEQNSKKYGSLSQNKPILREFINPPYIDFNIAQATPLEERPGNIMNSNFTGFCCNKWNLRGKRQDLIILL